MLFLRPGSTFVQTGQCPPSSYKLDQSELCADFTRHQSCIQCKSNCSVLALCVWVKGLWEWVAWALGWSGWGVDEWVRVVNAVFDVFGKYRLTFTNILAVTFTHIQVIYKLLTL